MILLSNSKYPGRTPSYPTTHSLSVMNEAVYTLQITAVADAWLGTCDDPTIQSFRPANQHPRFHFISPLSLSSFLRPTIHNIHTYKHTCISLSRPAVRPREEQRREEKNSLSTYNILTQTTKDQQLPRDFFNLNSPSLLACLLVYYTECCASDFRRSVAPGQICCILPWTNRTKRDWVDS